jgi:uncharacterized protein YfcZ (UPF0381/DUF406 family)
MGMNIYKVVWRDADVGDEYIAWFSTRLQAEKQIKELIEVEKSFTTEPTIQECKIELTKKDVLSFLNFYCKGAYN